MKPKHSLLPSFIVLGAQKAGTTALHEWLVRQPGLCLPASKETHFFSHVDKFAQGIDWYTRQFPGSDHTSIRGEVDPEYLFSAETPARMKSCGLRPRFLVVVRDPLARAYSHYRMSVRRGVEPLSFPDALRSEEERLASAPEKGLLHYSYMARGCYTEQVQRFRKAFPESPLLVVGFETLFSEDTHIKTFSHICHFIGLEHFTPPGVAKRHHPATAARFSWLNALIWDKERFFLLRRLVRLTLPFRALRDVVARKVYTLNQRPATSTPDWLQGVDASFVLQANAEAVRISKAFNVDTRSWLR